MVDSSDAERRRLGMLPMTLQERMATWFEENGCKGDGDLRTPVTLEALQRVDNRDFWIIHGHKCGRVQVMQIMLAMVSSGTNIIEILSESGMPSSQTYQNWLKAYKPFAESMELAEHMYAAVKAYEAMQIIDREGDIDGKQAYRDRCRAELRMRIAEVCHPKKYSRKQLIDVTRHLEDLPPEELASQLRSVLISNQDLIKTRAGLGIVDLRCQDAEIVETEEIAQEAINPQTIGMQGALDGLNEPDNPDEGET